MQTPVTFDYRALDTEDQIAVQERTKEIKGKLKDAVNDIFQIGEALTDVQQRLASHKSGTFRAYLWHEFHWSKSTAYSFIAVYRWCMKRFGGCPNFGQLNFAASALYAVSAASTPEAAVDEMLERAEAGEEITHSLAQEIITRHKPSAPTADDIDEYIEDDPHADLDDEVSQVATPSAASSLPGHNGHMQYDVPLQSNGLGVASQFHDTPAERAPMALASIYDLHVRGNVWIDPGQLERTLRGMLPVLAEAGALKRQQKAGRLGLETQYQITALGCQQIGKPFNLELDENAGIDHAYDPSDPAQNPIAETHPNWAGSPHPAICPVCGIAHSQWKPIPGAYWRCRICDANNRRTEIRDDAMEVETPEDRAAQERMAKRRAKGGASGSNILHSSASNEWYTPEEIIEAAREVMGGIDLDPASCARANEVVQASIFYTEASDGLVKPWHGRVWLNAPYGRAEGNESNQSRWSARLISAWHNAEIRQAIMLCNAATAANWFKPLWNYPLCFPYDRIVFYNEFGPQPNPTHDNCLVYFGDEPERFYDVFEQFGQVIIPQRVIMPQASAAQVVSVAMPAFGGHTP